MILLNLFSVNGYHTLTHPCLSAYSIVAWTTLIPFSRSLHSFSNHPLMIHTCFSETVVVSSPRTHVPQQVRGATRVWVLGNTHCSHPFIQTHRWPSICSAIWRNRWNFPSSHCTLALLCPPRRIKN